MQLRPLGEREVCRWFLLCRFRFLIKACPELASPWSLWLPRESAQGWESVSLSNGWHQVNVGLGLLEFRETTSPAQAADTALLIAALFEPGVHREPRVCPNRSSVVLAAHAAGAVDIAGEHA